MELLDKVFQSSSGLLAGCNDLCICGHLPEAEIVSILIRPSGRMQPPLCHTQRDEQTCFNPHPAFWPDATNQVGFNEDGTSVSILIRPEGRMQRDEGCLCGDCGYDVSILIRPSGRMQRSRRWCRRARYSCFNPHPAFWPDATRLWLLLVGNPLMFQSSSGLLAGCNLGNCGQ